MKIVLIAALTILSFAAHAAETRCGFLANPTPENFWLSDKDGEWTISTQGGYSISDNSWDHMDAAYENTSSAYYNATNGRAHGVFCSCITGAFELTGHKQGRVLRVDSSSQSPLATCDRDKSMRK